jgi:hypothetical protein
VCNHLWSSLSYSQNVVYLRTEDVLTDGSKLALVDAVARWTGWRAEDTLDMGAGRYFGHSKGDGKGRGAGAERDVLVEAVNRYADFVFERALGFVREEEGRTNERTSAERE